MYDACAATVTNFHVALFIKFPHFRIICFSLKERNLWLAWRMTQSFNRSSTSDISLRVREAAVRAAAQLAQVLAVADAVMHCVDEH